MVSATPTITPTGTRALGFQPPDIRPSQDERIPTTGAPPRPRRRPPPSAWLSLLALVLAIAAAACAGNGETTANITASPGPKEGIAQEPADDPSQPNNASDRNGDASALPPATTDDRSDIQKEDTLTPEPAPDPVDGDERGEPLPYDNAHALTILAHLATEIGARMQGTNGSQAAADFLAAQFESLGYEVERQPFPITPFTVGEVSAQMDGESFPATALRGSAGGVVRGRLVIVPGLGQREDYAAIAVTNAVVLVERGILFFQEKVAVAEEQGAAAILIFNNEPGSFSGDLGMRSTIPALAITRADGLALKEAATAATVEVAIVIESSASSSENVIARTPDGECRIYVGGHYDTVPDVSGANDNASGTALVMEVARAYASSRGGEWLCFVGFGAEEATAGSDGLTGSTFLANGLGASGEAARVIAMLNLDVTGAGHTIILVGSAALTELASELAADLAIPAQPGRLPQGSGSDHLAFAAIGVPVIFPTVLGAPIHVPEDTFTNIDPSLLDRVGRLAHAVLGQLIVLASG